MAAQTVNSLCSECWKQLESGTTRAAPHGYLVAWPGSDARGTSVYKCLLCNASLVRDAEAGKVRWARPS
jgi:DNA-directed RNA polymerase subunit RPC12/RpoP